MTFSFEPYFSICHYEIKLYEWEIGVEVIISLEACNYKWKENQWDLFGKNKWEICWKNKTEKMKCNNRKDYWISIAKNKSLNHKNIIYLILIYDTKANENCKWKISVIVKPEIQILKVYWSFI